MKGELLRLFMSTTTNREYAPHQQRVIDEANELREKHSKLGDFTLNNAIFPTLPKEERDDLEMQYVIMGQYLDILDRRISRF